MLPCNPVTGNGFPISTVLVQRKDPPSRGLGDFEHDPSRQARRLASLEYDSASLRKWQAGLDGPLIQGKLLQDRTKSFARCVPIRDLRVQSAAPTHRKQACVLTGLKLD